MPSNIARWLNEFVVVETADDAFIGTLAKVDDDHVVVRTGYVGRPAVIAVDDIDLITPVDQHPDVAA